MADSVRTYPSRVCLALMIGALLAACAVPSPVSAPPPPPAPAPPTQTVPVETQPGRRRATVEEPQPLPAPVVREPTLGAASRALVSQAQTQVASKNYPVAASLDRARAAHRARQSAAVDRAGQGASGRRQLRAGGEHGPQGGFDSQSTRLARSPAPGASSRIRSARAARTSRRSRHKRAPTD